ncbi:MAG TPA: branched-chain amino acid ABC transporter permease [Trebonia sp.]
MELALSAIVSGIAVGVLFGLLAFSVVLLFKSTGVANFAQGNMAMFSTFIVARVFMAQFGLSLWPALILGAVAATAFGALVYIAVIRPGDNAGALNLTVRTLGVYLLLYAIVQKIWGVGSPYGFPSVFPSTRWQIGQVSVALSSIGILVVCLALVGLFALFFMKTTWGLQMRAMADNPAIARLLGVRTRWLTVGAWSAAGLIALIVGVLAAPTTLVAPEMMELYLLAAVTAAIVGGLSSLPGALVGGVIVGVISNVCAAEIGSEIAIVPVFALLVAILLIRPNGLFGRDVISRL